MEEKLWDDHRDAQDHESRRKEEQHDQALKQLLRNHFDIRLGRREPLGGGSSGNEVYRLYFDFRFGVRGNENGHAPSAPLAADKHYVVIKEGSLTSLLQATEAYESCLKTSNHSLRRIQTSPNHLAATRANRGT